MSECIARLPQFIKSATLYAVRLLPSHNAVSHSAGPEELKGYIEHLIAKLLEVIAGGTPDSQETALGALASAANAAGTSFQPFVEAVFPVLRQFMEVRMTHKGV